MNFKLWPRSKAYPFFVPRFAQRSQIHRRNGFFHSLVRLLECFTQARPIICRNVRADPGSLRYNARLAARPLLTQSVTTAVLFATGDITAQQLVEKKGVEKHDLVRTGRMALYGGCEYLQR